MSFAISNAVFRPTKGAANSLRRGRQRIGLLADMVIIAATVAIAALIFRSSFNFGLKTAVARSGIAWGCVALASALASADVITAVALKWSHKMTFESGQTSPSDGHDKPGDQMTFEDAQSRYIAPALASNQPSQNADHAQPAHQILNGLYLGSVVAFVQSAGIPFNKIEESGCPTPLDVSNPEKFCHIISVCPTIRSIQSLSLDSPDPLTLADFERGCNNNGIEWQQVGEMAYDDPEYWLAFVHECTFPKDELAGRTIQASQLDDNSKNRIIEQKNQIITDTPITDWFEPMFQVIDQAVLEGKKVLVHCQMGQSRSATLLAAYLINRFQLSADEALQYLKLKRSQVVSKFASELRAYESALRKSFIRN